MTGAISERPKLTFPPDEAAWVEEVYDAARVILEYGSGGSTVLAGEKLGCRVFSVESDKNWCENLIDGRFRAACFLTVMLRTNSPVTVLFDDYKNRPNYHVVEDYVKPAEMRGRMARFEVQPRSFPTEDMAKIFEIFGIVQ